MAYLVRDLITNAFYTSDVVSKDLQFVGGDQIQEGLSLLNEFLAIKSVNLSLIPYFSSATITGIVGQEVYLVPGLVSIDTLTFDLTDNFRMPMTQRTRAQYFGTARVNQINSLPMTWHAERCVGGTNIYVYFQPDQAYPFKVWGKFALTQITSLATDLSLLMDLYYISYLRYGLAEMICEFYGITLDPLTAKKLMVYEQSFKAISPPDFSMSKVTCFRKDASGFGWGDVYIGRGWRGGA